MTTWSADELGRIGGADELPIGPTTPGTAAPWRMEPDTSRPVAWSGTSASRPPATPSYSRSTASNGHLAMPPELLRPSLDGVALVISHGISLGRS